MENLGKNISEKGNLIDSYSCTQEEAINNKLEFVKSESRYAEFKRLFFKK